MWGRGGRRLLDVGRKGRIHAVKITNRLSITGRRVNIVRNITKSIVKITSLFNQTSPDVVNVSA